VYLELLTVLLPQSQALPCEISHRQLSPAAETLRQQIKSIIAEATLKQPKSQYSKTTIFEEDSNRNKVYNGILLDIKVSELVKQMDLGEVDPGKVRSIPVHILDILIF
jgi:hypothetical protein